MTLSASADAAGLGKLTVLSSLGEPLRAEIEVLDVAGLDLSTLTARMAPIEAFSQSGIERAAVLSSIRFTLEKKKRDGVVVKVHSSQSIGDPFLDMLVEFQWPTGRLVREYTVLLDPPGYAKKESFAPAALPTVADQVAEKPLAAPEPTPLPPPEKAKPEPKAVPTRKAPEAAKHEGDKYGPVKKGQNLYQIAGEVKPAEVSLEEMLVALYRSNPGAFTGKNMNRLVTGKILTVPTAEEAGAIGGVEARKEIRAQVADWNAYREKLASAVEAAPAPAAKEEPAKQAAAGKITTKTEDKAAKPSQDVLKLSKAGAGKAPAGEDKLRAMQEDLLAKEKTIKDANERIAQLEKTVKDMQSLLEVKNQSLAAAQQQAEPKKPEPQEAAKPEAKPEEKKAEVPAEAEPAEPKAAEAKPAEKPKAKPVAKPEPQPEPSLMDRLMGEPMYLGGLGALVLLLIGGGLVALRKIREKRAAVFQTSMLSGGDLVAPAEKPGAASDTSFLTDFSQAGLGTIDTNEVDPIAEAEVYMAYGRDGQAEEILKEAMVKDPHRYEIHLKLLEIYAGRKNLTAFETLATELYAALEGQHSPIWDKAAQMGRALDPKNPLYGTAPAAPAEEDMEKTMVLTPAKMEALQGAAVPEASLADLDFNLEPETAAAEAAAVDIDLGEAAPVEAEEMVDLSLPGEEAVELGESIPTPEAAPAHAEEEAGLDFILEEPAVEAPAPEETAPAAMPSDVEALDFDFEALTAAPAAPAAPAEEPAAEAGMEDILEMARLAEPAVEMPDLEAPLELPAEEAPVEAPLEMPSAELELPAFEVPVEEESIEAAPAPVVEVEEAGLNFDFNIEEPAAAEAPQTPEPAVPEMDLSGLSLELEEPAAEAEALPEAAPDESRWQEAATKLDLARAYMEMGDREGAREILQEVLKEGNDQQKQDAQSMLAEMA